MEEHAKFALPEINVAYWRTPAPSSCAGAFPITCGGVSPDGRWMDAARRSTGDSPTTWSLRVRGLAKAREIAHQCWPEEDHRCSFRESEQLLRHTEMVPEHDLRAARFAGTSCSRSFARRISRRATRAFTKSASRVGPAARRSDRNSFMSIFQSALATRHNCVHSLHRWTFLLVEDNSEVSPDNRANIYGIGPSTVARSRRPSLH